MEPTSETKPQLQLEFQTFSNDQQLQWMMKVFRQELSEPYSLYTYNYFLANWPQLSIFCYHKGQIIGCIIGNYEPTNPKKAYIAMLVVLKQFRRMKIAKKLFDLFYNKVAPNVDKIVLETQCINEAAVKFYTRLGFFKTRRMINYYMSGTDAFRLKLYIPKQQIKQGKNSNPTEQKEQSKIQTN